MTATRSGWKRAAWSIGLAACVASLGQSSQQIERLQEQLRQLQAEFERQQAQQREQIENLRQQIRALQAPPVTTNAWTASNPVRIAGGGASYLNLSVDGLFAAGSSTATDVEALQPGGHDPKQRGFTVQNVELTLTGAVDPYFRAQGNLLFQLDSGGESRVELEEAFLATTALPGNLQFKGGQFLTEFGRLNPTHPHAWSFVDQPLVNSRFLGGDGLRNPGAQLSWLIPAPFYSELFLTVQDSQGETAFSFRNDHGGTPLFGRLVESGRLKSFTDLLFVPRYALSFDLSDTQTLLAGASAAFGPNGSGPEADTQIYGVDVFWKWKSPRQHGGFPFVSWQTEAMLRRYEAAAYDRGPGGQDGPRWLPDERLVDYGFYSQLAYGFTKGWVAALRGDWLGGDRAAWASDPDRDPRWRLSPNLTWYPTEFSKIRLQYNYDDRQSVGVDHSVWLQLEFLLGSHAAHKF